MFPHSCGEELERLVAVGADPAAVVPDEFVVVKGGTRPLPAEGELFSGAIGPDFETAGAAVPHGQLRYTSVGAIRTAGGTVTWVMELSRYDTSNRQHVNITEKGPSVFSALIPNPVRLRDRIDGDR